jgi:hypothetical protein
MPRLVLMLVLLATLSGCASLPTEGASAAAEQTSSSPTALEPSSVACPQIDNEELPPECIPYDPQALMDSNQLYKERFPVDPDAFASFEAQRADITSEFKALQDSGTLSPDAVKSVLTDAGVGSGGDNVYAQDNIEGIIFGGTGPNGGCVLGTVSPTSIEMDIVGPIMDGGCTPAVGH